MLHHKACNAGAESTKISALNMVEHIHIYSACIPQAHNTLVHHIWNINNYHTIASYVVYGKSPGLLCLIFYLLRFWAMLKNLPIMLNIMPITTAIMPQFVYDFIILTTRLA